MTMNNLLINTSTTGRRICIFGMRQRICPVLSASSSTFLPNLNCSSARFKQQLLVRTTGRAFSVQKMAIFQQVGNSSSSSSSNQQPSPYNAVRNSESGSNTGGFTVFVPDFGENLSKDTRITVSRIVRPKSGEFVEEDDILLELIVHSLNDIPVDIKTPEGAFVKRVLVKENDLVKPGDPLFEMEYSGHGPMDMPQNPFDHFKTVASEMKQDPKIYKNLQESFARASSIGWAIIGGGVVIGLLLNWVWGKTHPNEKQKREKNVKV